MNHIYSQRFKIFLILLFFCGSVFPALAFETDQAASVVIGQPDMNHNGPNQGIDWYDPPFPTAKTLYWPGGVQVYDSKLFIADYHNSRVLIYDSIPTSNNPSANVAIGQPDMFQNYRNQHPPGEPPWFPNANTLHWPDDVYGYGGKLLIADTFNNRTIIFNYIPTIDNPSADVAIGQTSLIDEYYPNQEAGDPGPNTLFEPRNLCIYGGKVIMADRFNHRVLIFNSIPTTNNANANVVVGQPDRWSTQTNQGFGIPGANTLYEPSGVFASDNKLFITDTGNHRVLIFNNIPTADNTNANVVIGQNNFFSGQPNQGMGFPQANTLNVPFGNVYCDDTRLFIPDSENHRVLIYNSIPVTPGASADVVLGQANMNTRLVNQLVEDPDPYYPPPPAANTLYWPDGVFLYGNKLFVSDTNNNRVLIYEDTEPTPPPTNTPTPSVTPTPPGYNTPTPSPTPTLTPTDYKTPIPVRRVPGDYNGDGTSDIAVFRPSSGLWSIRQISRAYFGSSNDLHVPRDYDGDGSTDFGISRSTSALWVIRGITRCYFGAINDQSVPADYDGDGSADIGIFRNTSGLWVAQGVTRLYFGTGGDLPIPGDYSGDGTDDIAVFRQSSGLWVIKGLSRFYFGSSSYTPVSGDFDGDGSNDAGVFRASSGRWVLRGITRTYFGSSSDFPVPADFDGDGTDEIAIFRETSSLWVVRMVTRLYYGSSNDLPAIR